MSHRPSICLATFRYPPMNGGVAQAAARLRTMMSAEGFRVHVCVFATKEEPVESGVDIHRIDLPGEAEAPLERAMAMHSGLRLLDARHSFDLFHGFFLPAAQPCLQPAARVRRPVIASSRGSDATLWPADPRRRQIIETVLRRADWITTVSRDGLRRLAQLAPVEGRATVIPNSVNDAAFAVRFWPDPVCRGVVGTVAEFHPVKRIPLLIEAYAALPRAARSKLLLVGDFPDETARRKIGAAINRFRVASEVEITGYLDPPSVRACLRRMNVFVQCSVAEGFSNALLEAAAAGVPIVSTRTGGAEELLAEHSDALSIAAADPVSLSAAIGDICADGARAAQLSHSAGEAARRFSAAQEQAAWRDLYMRLINRASAPEPAALRGSAVRTQSASGGGDRPRA